MRFANVYYAVQQNATADGT